MKYNMMGDITIDIIEVDATDSSGNTPYYNLTLTNIDAETACRIKKLLIKNVPDVEFVTGTLAIDADGKVWI